MENQKSAIGLDGNLAAALGYPIGLIALILIFIEKDNKFVRFHAIQSLLWGLLLGIVWSIALVLTILLFFGGALAGAATNSGIIGIIVSLLGWVAFLLLFILGIVWFASIIFAAVKSYGGAKFSFPLVGKFAEKWSS